MMPADRAGISPARLVTLVCAAQVLAQIGAYTWPALLPGMMTLWRLDNSEAGWITGLFYLAYTIAVPVLVTLTDRIDAKRVYLCGVSMIAAGHCVFAFADGFWVAVLGRMLAGAGWAGTYMTGLKLLADRVDARLMSRAVAGHAAGVGVAGALSFVFADLVRSLAGWQGAFAVAGGCALAAGLIVAIFAPARTPSGATAQGTRGALFDFRPVFRNRSAMAYAFVYCFHTWEMNALRGWSVAFLAYVAAQTGDAKTWIAPTVVATAMALLGTGASIVGNEASIRFGRRRLIAVALTLSVLLGGTIGYVGTLTYGLAVAMVLAYGAVIWLDSSSLTAGTAGNADPERRGATLAVHSMLGYGGGFFGPLVVGWTLDLAGGMSTHGWSMAFGLIAGLMLLTLFAFRLMRPNELPGDRHGSND